MNETLIFADRQKFRDWLDQYGETSEGIWLIFGKKGGPDTLSAPAALEEALCFGWIDGVMQKIDETSYKKYFARRTEKSKWSDKNKKLVQVLIGNGMVTEKGMAAVEKAKKNGMWDGPGRIVIDEEQIRDFKELVRQYEPAYENLLSMPLSVQKNYSGLYLDAKYERTRENRLMKIVDRLNLNLRPM